MFLLFSLFIGELPTIHLAERGVKPKYVIMIPKTRPGYQLFWKYAAQQLQKGIANITGVTLDIVDDSKPLPSYVILVGHTQYTDRFLLAKTKDLSRDLFEIKAAGERLIITGGSRGTIYGCYDILEKYGGVRYYTSWMDVYPPAKTFSIPYGLYYTEEAKVYYREQYSSDIILNDFQASRTRTNAGDAGMWDLFGGGLGARFGTHSFAGLMPASKYPLASYPEQWALYNKKRTTGAPCLSNEQTYQIMTKRVIEERRNFSSFYYEVSQGDNGIYCQCPSCAAKTAKYDSYSGVIVEFLNRMSDEVEKLFPGQLIRTFAYVYSRKPPVNIELRPTIVIRLCSIEIDYAHPFTESKQWSTVAYAKEVDEWGKLTKHLNVYDYVTNFNYPILIHPNYHVLVPNLRNYIRNHLEGYLPEDSMGWRTFNNSRYIKYHAHFTEYKQYMITKVLWNPDIDEEEVKHDFLKGYYGRKAGSYIKQYMEEAVKRVNDNPQAMTAFHWGLPAHIDEHFVTHARWLWERAIEAAKEDTDPRYVFNVKMGMVSIIHGLYMWNVNRELLYEFTPTKLTPKPSQPRRDAAAFILENCPGKLIRNPISKGVCFLTDTDANEDILRRNLHLCLDDIIPATITSNPYSASFSEYPFNGRPVLFSLNGDNYLDSMFGFDYYMPTSSYALLSNGNDYKITLNTSTEAKYEFKNNDVKEEKSYLIHSNGLSFTASSNYYKTPTKSTTPVISFSFAFGDGASVAWNINNVWYSYALADDVEWEYIGNTTKGATKITICSPVTKKGAEITFPSSAESVTLKLNKTSKTIRVFVYMPYKLYTGFFSFKSDVKLLPSCSGFTIPTKQPSLTQYKRIIFPDAMMRYSEGSGTRPSPDDESKTGRAIHFFENKRSVQLYLYAFREQPNYIEDATYDGRMSLRCQTIDKTKNIAFWYGFSPNGTDRIFYPRTPKMNNSYVWYSFKNWSINWDESCYVGMDQGCTSLYLDQIEFTMVKPPQPTPLPVYKEELLSQLADIYYPGLSPGEVAGITVIAIIVVLAVVVAVFIYLNKKSNNKPEEERSKMNETVIA